jgi:hypothetical protein
MATRTQLPDWGIMNTDAGFCIDETTEPVGVGANGKVFKAMYFGAPVAAKTLFKLVNPALYGLTKATV